MAHKSMRKPILVPVDFSPHAELALKFAGTLADSLNTSLTVLHVVHDPGEAPGYYVVKGRKKQLNRLEDVAEEMLSDFLKKMVKQNPDIESIKKASTKLVIGLPVTRVLEVAKKINAFMIIMGSKGRTRLSTLFLGSKAEQVVHLSPIPVTIVKADKKDNEGK
jgi:nucleotide-binding universal stress UspA family protein